jgi:hypothetical protein
MLIRGLFFAIACSCALAQDSVPPDPAAPVLSSPSVDEKWDFFLKETVTPLMLVETAPDAVVSQLTRSAPLYGKHFWKHDAFVKRFGATLADNTSENFFSRRHTVRALGAFAQDVAADRIRHQPGGGYADRLRFRFVQLGQRNGMRDERRAFECLLSAE